MRTWLYLSSVCVCFLQSALCRSSQPLAGLLGRSAEDEQMIQSILRSSPSTKTLHVLDTRPRVRPSHTPHSMCVVYALGDREVVSLSIRLPVPCLQLNAMANRAAGKGYEAAGYYPNTNYQFYNIQNIHVMRESLQRLIEGDIIITSIWCGL